MGLQAEEEFKEMGLSDRAIKSLNMNNLTSKENLLIFIGNSPRKLLELQGVGKSVYQEILAALQDSKLDRAEKRHQAYLERKRIYEKRHELALYNQIIEKGLQGAVEQYKFHPDRKWSLDIAFPNIKLAIEIDGGIWKKGKGGHNSGKGYEEDRLKDQAALLLGWAVYRVTPKMISSGDAITTIAVLLEQRGIK